MDAGKNPGEIQQTIENKPDDGLDEVLNTTPGTSRPTDGYVDELDLSDFNIIGKANAKICISTLLNYKRIGKLILPLNDEFVRLLRDEICSSYHCIEIDELDISNNDKFGTDEDSSMMYLGDVIKKCSVKKLAMRDNLLNCLHMIALKKSLDDYSLNELDISRSQLMTPSNRKLSVVRPNIIAKKLWKPALGDGATVVTLPVAEPILPILLPILPNITEKLCMNNWDLLDEECEQLEEFLNSSFLLSAPIITYGQHGNRTLQKSFKFSKFEKSVGHDGAEIQFGDNILLVPSLKEETHITVHSYMEFSSLHDGYYPVSPIIECGPTGIEFENPAKLKIKTWLKKGKDVTEAMDCLKVVSRKSKEFYWQEVDNWKVEQDNWEVGDGVVVTLFTNHFTDFRVLINKWIFNLILLECNFFYNASGNIAPVFYVQNSDLKSEIEADLEKNNRSPILPIPKKFDAHLDDEIICKIQADGFRFSNKEEILMEFSGKSISDSKTLSKNYAISEACEKTTNKITFKCSIKINTTDRGCISILEEDAQYDWPLKGMQIGGGADKQAALFNIDSQGDVQINITDSKLAAMAGDNAQLRQSTVEGHVTESDDPMQETVTYAEELEFSKHDIIGFDNAKISVSKLQKHEEIGKLRLPLNNNFIELLRDALHATNSNIKIKELDITNADKSSIDESPSSMTSLGEVIKKCSVEKLAMRDISLNQLHMTALKEILDDYRINELDISSSHKMPFNVDVVSHPGQDTQKFKITLASGDAVVIRPSDEIVTPILSNVTNMLLMKNRTLREKERVNLEEFLNSRYLLTAPVITYGDHGKHSIQKIFKFDAVKKSVGNDGASINFGDNTLLVPPQKLKAQINVHSYMDFSNLDDDFYPVSPIIECGPTEIEFEIPVKIKIKTWLKKGRDVNEARECLKVLWRKSKEIDWQEANDWELEPDDWEVEDRVVVTRSTKRLSDSRVLINKKAQETILLECNFYYNAGNNIAPVFYPQSDDWRSKIKAEFECDDRKGLRPRAVRFEAFPNDEIACQIQADGFRFSREDKASMNFEVQSVSFPLYFNFTIHEINEKLPRIAEFRCIIIRGPQEEKPIIVLDEWTGIKWPIGEKQNDEDKGGQNALIYNCGIMCTHGMNFHGNTVMIGKNSRSEQHTHEHHDVQSDSLMSDTDSSQLNEPKPSSSRQSSNLMLSKCPQLPALNEQKVSENAIPPPVDALPIPYVPETSEREAQVSQPQSVSSPPDHVSESSTVDKVPPNTPTVSQVSQESQTGIDETSPTPDPQPAPPQPRPIRKKPGQFRQIGSRGGVFGLYYPPSNYDIICCHGENS